MEKQNIRIKLRAYDNKILDASTESRGNATAINATVPLANMFGYINNLRSSTQGRAQYTMQFSHYDKVPQNVQDEVTKKLA